MAAKAQSSTKPKGLASTKPKSRTPKVQASKKLKGQTFKSQSPQGRKSQDLKGRKSRVPGKPTSQSQNALIVGISDYPSPIKNLPAVAADVREMGKLLKSKDGAFQNSGVTVLTNKQATRKEILSALRATLGGAPSDQAVFVYLAGHGGIEKNQYFFIAHDTDSLRMAETGVSLTEIKALFDKSRSSRVFLWLDFCHSGGMLARGKRGLPDDRNIINRTIQVFQGHGKVIVAACSPTQFAYEDPAVGHGLFTDALLRGLKGGAASDGEVTSNSLFDFIDREVGNARQRPMQSGHTTGRIVLMHYKDRATGKTMTVKRPKSEVAKPKSKSPGTKGTWVMLGQHFFLAESVRRAKDGTIAVVVISSGGEDEAHLAGLRTPRHGGSPTVPFACNNDAHNVRVKDTETETIGNRPIWTISLTPEDSGNDGNWSEMSINTGEKTLSADDLAKLRAGRILLNDPPPSSDSRQSRNMDSGLEGYIQGFGNRYPVRETPIRSTYTTYGRNPHWKHFARLQVVYALKASGTIDHILELSFGAIRSGRLPVRFRGRRQRHPTSPPVTIDIDGFCPLG